MKISMKVNISRDLIIISAVHKNGGIPHARRTECAKIKISQSDFSNLKFGKKVNISRDWSIDIGRI